MPAYRPVVLVTGATRGLGRAIADALRAQGARLVLNYFESVGPARDLAEQRQDAVAVQADVRDSEQVRQMFEDAERHFGDPVTVVVNSALVDFKFNGDERSKLDAIAWEDFEKQLRGTVQGALNTTQAALAGFGRARERGLELRIINIGTSLLHNPVVPYHDYVASKGAILALTRTTAAELGPKGVTCNMVTGGLLATTDASSHTPSDVFEQVRAVTPTRRVTTPEDVAAAVIFFASDAARNITGQDLVVDGGLVMH